MSYAIIGFGAIGQALARAFARAGIEVAVVASRPPEAIVAAARAIGPGIVPKTLRAALDADVVVLAVPFRAHREVAAARDDWRGKTVVDATNAYGVPLAELDDRPSSVVVAEAFPGAAFAKAFNHLPAAALARDPARGSTRRVIFVSSDDGATAEAVAGHVERLGFAAVGLGPLAEGGRLVQARDRTWAPLMSKDLFRQEQ